MDTDVSNWLFWAVLSAVFAALTAIFSKIGVDNINPDFATFIRTIVVLLCLSAILAATGQFQAPASISARTYVFLVMSGLATGASWICYFRALKLGNASQVAPIDKLSVVLVRLSRRRLLAGAQPQTRITVKSSAGGQTGWPPRCRFAVGGQRGAEATQSGLQDPRRLRVAAAFLAERERAAAGRRAAALPPRRPPLRDGAWLTFLPRPEPDFLPPWVSALTVDQARRSASFFRTPRFS